MLIIPALHISNGRCMRTAIGEAGTEGLYPFDPVRVARLWRGENAKALHVVALDLPEAGMKEQSALLKSVVDAVDIPVQLSGGLQDFEDITAAFEDIGVSRVVLPTDVCDDPVLLQSLLERFGPRKIVIHLAFSGAEIISHGSGSQHEESVIARASMLKESGVQRVVLADSDQENLQQRTLARFLHSLAERTNLSVTLIGSVQNYADLKLLQNLHPRKIDSIILDEALYSNAFPCQKIWRQAEQQLIAQQKLL
jgi:phosphoribosylformimino-5-aminoimidazole carboxamide ribotide isomerase